MSLYLPLGDVLGIGTWLQKMVCWLSNLPTLFLVAMVSLFNLIMVGVGAAIDGLAHLLPVFPAYSSFLPTGLLAAVNWFYPVGALAAALGTVASMYLVWLGVRIALNWLKVTMGG